MLVWWFCDVDILPVQYCPHHNLAAPGPLLPDLYGVPPGTKLGRNYYGQVAGDMRQEAGDKRLETRDKRQETRDKRQETRDK